MTTKQETFTSFMQELQYRHDARTVFNDFLTLSICALSRNYATGKSEDEDLYLSTIEKYKKDDSAKTFPQLFALLVNEMTERLDSDLGNDVLGDFYEQNLSSKGKSQFFTPWTICKFMAQITVPAKDEEVNHKRPLRVLDPACGSGRMLLASASNNEAKHKYYGIDIDHTCVQITALNLFLNGLFNSEVMCADSLRPDDFHVSYKISFFPLGIYRITEKEHSTLWHLHKNSFMRENNANQSANQEMHPSSTQASQLRLF